MNRFYFGILIGFIILLGYFSYQILEPFLVPVAWAIVFSFLFYPVYAIILRYLRWTSLASLLALGLILIMVIGPFTYFSFLLVQEVAALSENLRTGKSALENGLSHPAVQTVLEKITSLLQISQEELEKTISDQISRLGMELIGKVSVGIRNVITGALNFLIMALTIFFLFKEGPKFFKKVHQYLPFSEEQKGRLANQVRDIIISTIYGGVIVAMVQGTMGGLAFFILGISSPLLWGFAMAIASFLPLVGPFIIWIPASLYLYFQGAVGKAIALAVMGGGISSIDNFLRPLIIGRRTRMPFLFIFFSVLGGIKLFGLIGIVMGPMVLALFVSILEIFRTLGEKNLP